METLVMDKGKIMTGVTYTRGDFPKMDYEFVLEGKKIDGDDFFCTTTFPVGDSFCSFVVGGWSGRVVGLSSLDGMDASSNETRTNKEFKNDQWYKIRVRVSAKRIEAWIDGEKLVDETRRIGKSPSAWSATPASRSGSRRIKRRGGRNLRVRPLSDADKKEIAEMKPEKKN